MTNREFCDLACRLMRHPAAPYHEHAVSREVKAICAEHGLVCDEDEFGNLLVRLTHHKSTSHKHARAIVFAAHMDHPGFEMIQDKQRLRARFLGGVPDDYFRTGLRLRLMPGGIPAKLGKRDGKERIFSIRPSGALASEPNFAVWDLEDFAVRNGKIRGRACDDLVGVASALAALIELKRRSKSSAANAIAAISRAEEVGFHGALTLCCSKRIPKDALMISLETSRELPGVKMGKGVILRVGDRTSIFDSDAMRFLDEVALDLSKSRKGFNFQRALMSGGTCEATAYQEYGMQTGAVCVALGNYHNCGPATRIAAEYVNITDAVCMVDLLVGAALHMPRFQQIVRKFPNRLEKTRKDALIRLRRARL